MRYLRGINFATMKTKVLIVDDEKYSRENLSLILKEYFPNVTEIGQADSMNSAYEAIINLKPDLVFLDIIMPPHDSFTLLKKFDTISFEIIFITAFNEYAIDAIRHSATDYILKPIDIDTLRDALQRAERKIFDANRIRTVNKKLVLNTREGYVFLEPNEIVHASVDDGTKVVLQLKANKQIQLNKNLNEVEELLIPYSFFRSHRGHIINLAEIIKYIPDRKGGCVIMSDKSLIPIAARRKDEFLSIIMERE